MGQRHHLCFDNVWLQTYWSRKSESVNFTELTKVKSNHLMIQLKLSLPKTFNAVPHFHSITRRKCNHIWLDCYYGGFRLNFFPHYLCQWWAVNRRCFYTVPSGLDWDKNSALDFLVQTGPPQSARRYCANSVRWCTVHIITQALNNTTILNNIPWYSGVLNKINDDYTVCCSLALKKDTGEGLSVDLANAMQTKQNSAWRPWLYESHFQSVPSSQRKTFCHLGLLVDCYG